MGSFHGVSNLYHLSLASSHSLLFCSQPSSNPLLTCTKYDVNLLLFCSKHHPNLSRPTQTLSKHIKTKLNQLKPIQTLQQKEHVEISILSMSLYAFIIFFIGSSLSNIRRTTVQKSTKPNILVHGKNQFTVRDVLKVWS